jgi:hypothetical protein
MTSDITLELDHDGVRLVQHDAEGKVRRGTVGLEDPDFEAKLAALRDDFGAHAPADVEVVLPSALVAFLDAGDTGDEELAIQVREATGCTLEDLLIERSGDTAAVVERTTLEEARAFAEAHGFVPRAYLAPHPEAERPPVVFQPEAPVAMAFRTARAPEPHADDDTSAPGPVATPPPGGTVPDDPSAPEVEPQPPQPMRTPHDSRARSRLALAPLFVAAGIVALALLGGAIWYVAGDPSSPGEQAREASAATDDMAAADPQADPEPVPSESGRASPAVDRAPVPPEPEPGAATGSPPEDRAPTPPPLVSGGETAGGPAPPALPPGVEPPEVAARPAMPTQPGTARVAAPEPGLPPPPPGTVFRMDARGFVQPTEDGALTPNGVRVHAGPPPLRPPPETIGAADLARSASSVPGAGSQPETGATDLPATGATAEADPGAETAPEAEAAPEAGNDAVAADEPDAEALRPRPRPARPEPAPTDIADDAAAEPPAAAPAEAATDFARLAEDARAQTAAAAAGLDATRAADPPPPEPVGQLNVAVQPSLPTRASVADRATLDNAIRLERVNLIGVYGTPSDRRALVRLPTGRYVKVKVGDRVDGGRVAAIGSGELDYVKNGRRVTLRMPRG